ncbi:hypothetical protein [Halogeometricum sp. CBA1124]|uniref:hypothetical protein n=1 Tax=Halogeometricum sp. CBA1124 TaxID=2668071 RepID=UPI00142C3547|nr:hypothetical protein [Halogeometricum sp. CBA1124]MUV56228.1 hypothetical protein [Halogeometricum sp. CBA1124]
MTETDKIHREMQEAISKVVRDLDDWKALPTEWSEVTGLPAVGLTDESLREGPDTGLVHRITIRAESDSRYEVIGFSGRRVDGEYKPTHHIAWMSCENREYDKPPLSGLDAAIDYVRMVCNSALIRSEDE